ncbi:MAG: hypothetical protein ACKVOP_03025 [Sphingomonadaceae bacterium]
MANLMRENELRPDRIDFTVAAQIICSIPKREINVDDVCGSINRCITWLKL